MIGFHCAAQPFPNPDSPSRDSETITGVLFNSDMRRTTKSVICSHLVQTLHIQPWEPVHPHSPIEKGIRKLPLLERGFSRELSLERLGLRSCRAILSIFSSAFLRKLTHPLLETIKVLGEKPHHSLPACYMIGIAFGMHLAYQISCWTICPLS